MWVKNKEQNSPKSWTTDNRMAASKTSRYFLKNYYLKNRKRCLQN